MSTYIELKIRGKIQAARAQDLLTFYKTGHMPKAIPEGLEEIFDSSLTPDKIIEELKKGVLDLRVEFKTMKNELEIFLKKFLPAAILSLDEGWYIHDFSEQPTLLTWDPQKKIISEKLATNDISQQTLGEADEHAEANEEWEAEYGNITPEQWRRSLARLLELMADLGRQKAIFINHDVSNEKLPVQNWADLGSILFTALNLENGFQHAHARGFLARKESKLLKPLHEKFVSYVPADYHNDAKTLRDPEWVEITEMAKALVKTLVPDLKKI